MKRLSILIIGLTTMFVSCTNSSTSNQTTTDSTETNNDIVSDYPIVESADLFKELKGDIAVINEKYVNKRIVIKNVLIAGGNVGEDKLRHAVFVPYQDNKIGYLPEMYQNPTYIDHLKWDETSAFWKPYQEKKAFEASIYYLGNNKLGQICSNENENNIMILTTTFRNPTDFSILKLPKLYPVSDKGKINFVANFIEVLDIEGQVAQVGNKAIELTDLIILNHRPHPASDINNIVESIKNTQLQEENTAQKEKDLVDNKENLKGLWVGSFNGKTVKLEIVGDNDVAVAAYYILDNHRYYVIGHSRTNETNENGLYSIALSYDISDVQNEEDMVTLDFNLNYKSLSYDTELKGTLNNKPISFKRH